MAAGRAGHAFLASWLVHRDLALADQAFDASLTEPEQPSRPGWHSVSALSQFHSCPTRYYLARLHNGTGLELVPTDEPTSKEMDHEAERLAQTREACHWLASEGLDGSADLDTWGTEVYLETPEPFHFRMRVDEVAWSRSLDALLIRDHKFTFRADQRTVARMLWGDQLLLYAATWNRWAETWGQPRCHYVTPNVIVVGSKGTQVMACDPQLVDPEREALLWKRLERVQLYADAFRVQAETHGWTWAREFQQPDQCIGFGACPFIAVCHQGEPLTSTRYRPSSRPVEPIEDSDA